MANKDTPLPPMDDASVAAFVRDGFLVVRPPPSEVPPAVHAKLFESFAALSEEARQAPTPHLSHLGDNLLARIPALREVLACPTLRTTLKGVLGDDAALHPHHFLHKATPNDQGWHQDGNLPWNARGHVRSHFPTAVLVFYYPQPVGDDMGPTEVVPGSQYFDNSFEDGEEVHGDDRLDRGFTPEAGSDPDLAGRDRRLAQALATMPAPAAAKRLTLPEAGAFVIVHHDIVHRGTRQAPGCDKLRFMAKFTFLRTSEPCAPSWAHSDGFEPDFSGMPAPFAAAARRTWSWLLGQPVAAPGEDIASLASQLNNPSEPARRLAGRLLPLHGASALPALVSALDSPAPEVRRMASFALGELRLPHPSLPAALSRVLATDPDHLARSNAAHALGTLARAHGIPGEAVRALLDRLAPGAEQDTVANAGMSRSTVRQCAALALVQAACAGSLSPDDAAELVPVAAGDGDRYVRGLCGLALSRAAGVPAWAGRLIGELLMRVGAAPPEEAERVGAANLWGAKPARL
ncbi:hypothetical protein DFJ74DRAFT_734670 [Hyaloraphidium curvatum]|nr:hypothetical protein DFJ74DRAFT_734670 [Hyaloraphidium curvatum]